MSAPAINYRVPLDPNSKNACPQLISTQDIEYACRLRGVFFSRFLIDAETMKTSVLNVIDNVPGAVQQATTEWESEYKIYGSAMPALREQHPWRLGRSLHSADILTKVRAHRFAFLPRLMLAVVEGRIPSSEVFRFLSDWCRFAAMKRSRSTAFVSTLVVIQRNLALVWAYAILAAMNRESDRALSALLLKILKNDLKQIPSSLGNSAPNNHLLVDHFAGWFFGEIFDGLFTIQWSEKFERKFVHEFCRQVLPDGTGFECSTHYHEFDLEVGAMYMRMLRKSGRSEPAEMTSRIRNMLKFKLATWPTEFGNGTEDPLFALVNHQRIPISTWEKLAEEFNITRKLGDSSCDDDWYSILMGKVKLSNGDKVSDGSSSLDVFPDGGYMSSFDPASGLNLVFRTAPSDSSRVTAGHSHADMLSIALSENGHTVLGDPGTYTYRRKLGSDRANNKNWRSYFAGPLAHNNVAIQGEDPLGPLNGDFRDNPYKVEAEYSIAAEDQLVKVMNSRLRGGGGYDKHFRSVVHKIGEYYLITDMVPPEVPLGRVRCTYQFSARFELTELTDRNATLTDGMSKWSVCVCDSAGKIKHGRGCLDPIEGWVSPEYGSRVPAIQLGISFRSSTIMTAIVYRGDGKKTVKVQSSGISDGIIPVEIHCPEKGKDFYLITTGSNPRVFRNTSSLEKGYLWYSSCNDGKSGVI